MSREVKKVQSKCIQTRLTHEGQLIEYRLIYPIKTEFKWHLETHEPDEATHVQVVKTKSGKLCTYYVRTNTNFNVIRKAMYLIMIKSHDFAIKELQNKKITLVDMFSNL